MKARLSYFVVFPLSIALLALFFSDSTSPLVAQIANGAHLPLGNEMREGFIQGPANAYDDEFDDPDLNPQWSWIREDSSHWSLTSRPGYLRIITQRKDLWRDSNTAPVLLQASPSGDFAITTRIVISPQANYQQGGLVIYGDDDNYIRLTFGYFNGQGFEFGKEVGGDFQSIVTSVPSGSSFHLKVVKVGQNFDGYYSQDGSNWSSIGRHTNVNISVSQVGLSAFNGTNVPGWEIPVDFDFFRVQATTPAATNTPTRTPTKTATPSTVTIEIVDYTQTVAYGGSATITWRIAGATNFGHNNVHYGPSSCSTYSCYPLDTPNQSGGPGQYSTTITNITQRLYFRAHVSAGLSGAAETAEYVIEVGPAPTRTSTATSIPQPTNTPTSTQTSARTPTPTKTPRPPASTPTPTRTATPTRTRTPLPTATYTSTPNAAPSPTWGPTNTLCGQAKIASQAPPCNLCTFIFVLISPNNPVAEWYPPLIRENAFYRIRNPQVAPRNPPFQSQEYGPIQYQIVNWSSYEEISPTECPLAPTSTPTPKPADLIISDITIAPTIPSALDSFSIIMKVKNTGDTKYNPGDGNYKVEVRFITTLRDQDWTLYFDSENAESVKRMLPAKLPPVVPSGSYDTTDITLAGLIIPGAFNGRMEVHFVPKSGDSNLDNNTKTNSLIVNGLVTVSCGATLFDIVSKFLLGSAEKAGYIGMEAATATDIVLDTIFDVVPCVLNQFDRECIANALDKLLSLISPDKVFDAIAAIIEKLFSIIPDALGCTLDIERALLDVVGRLSGRGISANAVVVESPIYVLVSNSRGQRAGFLDDGTPVLEIADARIVRQGERKFLIYSGIDTTQVRVKGIDTGIFSLLFTISRGNTATEVEYINVPTTAMTVGMIDTRNDQYTMSIDQNGDGVIDATRAPDNVKIIDSQQKLYLPLMIRQTPQ